jgi:hypothetical protein
MKLNNSQYFADQVEKIHNGYIKDIIYCPLYLHKRPEVKRENLLVIILFVVVASTAALFFFFFFLLLFSFIIIIVLHEHHGLG